MELGLIGKILFLRTVNIFFTETEGFKIDTMGTYHGMTLKSVTVSSYCVLFVLDTSVKDTNDVMLHLHVCFHVIRGRFREMCAHKMSKMREGFCQLHIKWKSFV